jgi:MutS domain V
MKTLLMHPDRDFDLDRPLPWNAGDLVQDLELETLFGACAEGDAFLFKVARQALLSGVAGDHDTILYRQAVFADCLTNASLVHDLYGLAVAALERERGDYLGNLGRYPGWILYRSVEVLTMLVGMLRKLRALAAEHAAKFRSPGFRRFFAAVQHELDDAYFAELEQHLKRLKFRRGVLISACLGRGNKGLGYVLRKPHAERRGLVDRVLGPKPPVFRFTVDPRDEAGTKTLSDLKDRGIASVANALAQSADHILGFFAALRTELAFYLGAMNLHSRLSRIGGPLCFPVPLPPGRPSLSCVGLYDAGLALNLERRVIDNALAADGKDLIVITGANQGGKSTFLRSLGVAQLLMQAGLFVPAQAFQSELCDGLFTHYRREEDDTMESGKLDEELKRMSEIVERLTPNPMILLNESFAATNEREGSEIASQVTRALLEAHKRTLFVTHLYAFAHALYARRLKTVMFLRAEREPDGRRSFKIAEEAPLETSYGEDLYRRVFDRKPRAVTAA